MSGEAYEKLRRGLADAIKLERAAAIVRIRKGTGLSQTAFAAKIRVPVGTIRDWEQARRAPDAAAETLLLCIAADSHAAFALIERAFDQEKRA